jgi:hypothetical protein
MTGQEVDRPPFMSVFHPHEQTYKRWERERPDLIPRLRGVPFEGRGRGWYDVGVNVGASRMPATIVLEDSDEQRVERWGDGTVWQFKKQGDYNYHRLEVPIHTHDDWRRYKERFLDPDDPARFPDDWAQRVAEYRQADYPLMLKHHGIYGFARNNLGDEQLMVAMYDQPDFVHDLMDSYTDIVLSIWEKVASTLQIDVVECWEDMASRSAMLISPAMFEEFMAPNLRKVSAFARRHGIPVVLVDSDGRVDQLAGLLADCGVNAFYPVEVGAGNDPFAMHQQHPSLGLLGALRKEALCDGSTRAAVDIELAKAQRLLQAGRFIPAVDHGPLSNTDPELYLYFCDQLQDIWTCGGTIK